MTMIYTRLSAINLAHSGKETKDALRIINHQLDEKPNHAGVQLWLNSGPPTLYLR